MSEIWLLDKFKYVSLFSLCSGVRSLIWWSHIVKRSISITEGVCGESTLHRFQSIDLYKLQRHHWGNAIRQVRLFDLVNVVFVAASNHCHSDTNLLHDLQQLCLGKARSTLRVRRSTSTPYVSYTQLH